MPEGKVSKKRFAESGVGKAAGVLLAVLWIASMSAVDAHAYSTLPYMLGLGAVLLLFVWGLLRGDKLVRLPWLAWLSLAAGGYFWVRCIHSYSQIESWRESALILSCALFYIAGIYGGQAQSNRSITRVLVAALAVNLVAFIVMRHPHSDLRWLGRPAMSLTGENTPYLTLYVYKNFAALFLSLGGMVLLWRALWKGRWSASTVGLSIMGGIAVAAALMCGSRGVWLVLPAAAAVGWILWLVLRLYAGQRIGTWTVLIGMLLVALLGIGLYDLFFGELMSRLFSGVDTHLRYLIWSNLCEVIPNVPVWGYGVGASQWEIVPHFSEWVTPNYAHNEYLQAWVDYGPVGVLLVVGILIVHLLGGFMALTAETPSGPRRTAMATAVLVLTILAVGATTDFVWHDFSLATMAAYCCGVLASPYPRPAFSWKTAGRQWAEGSGPRLTPVRAQGLPGRLLLLLLGAGMLWGIRQQWEHTHRAWLAQWEYDNMVKNGASPAAQRAFLGGVMQHYPDPAVMNRYALIPYTDMPDWAQMESLLWLAHRANPKQLFVVVMLADVMGRQGKCVETEKLLRRCYVGDGMNGNPLTMWPSYYSANLLQWAQSEMSAGHLGRARSIFNYAFRIGQFYPGTAHRGGIHRWTEGGSPQRKQFVAACRTDAATLNALNIPEDHSWQLPLEPNGKPALYRRLGAPAEQKP